MFFIEYDENFRGSMNNPNMIAPPPLKKNLLKWEHLYRKLCKIYTSTEKNVFSLEMKHYWTIFYK